MIGNYCRPDKDTIVGQCRLVERDLSENVIDSQEEYRRSQLHRWASFGEIRAERFEELVYKIGCRYIDWLCSIVSTVELPPGVDINSATTSALYALFCYAWRYDPDGGVEFEQFVENGIRLRLRDCIEHVSRSAATVSSNANSIRETTSSTNTIAPRVRIEQSVTRLWDQFDAAHIEGVASAVFASVSKRLDKPNEKGESERRKQFRIWMTGNDDRIERFTDLVCTAYKAYAPWLMQQLGVQLVMGAHDPTKTLSSSLEMMAVCMWQFDPRQGSDFMTYAWHRIHRRIGKFLVEIDASRRVPALVEFTPPFGASWVAPPTPVAAEPPNTKEKRGSKEVIAKPGPATVSVLSAAVVEKKVETTPAKNVHADTRKTTPQQERDNAFTVWLIESENITAETAEEGAKKLAKKYAKLPESAAGKYVVKSICLRLVKKKTKTVAKGILWREAEAELLASARAFDPRCDERFVEFATGRMEEKMKRKVNDL